MATWRSTPPGKEASMGWLQGAFTPEPAVWGPKRRHTARESDFMLQCTATPRAPAGILMSSVIASKDMNKSGSYDPHAHCASQMFRC